MFTTLYTDVNNMSFGGTAFEMCNFGPSKWSGQTQPLATTM